MNLKGRSFLTLLDFNKDEIRYMKDPKEIVIGRKNEGNKNIRDIYYMVRAQDKYLALKRLADYYPNIYGIIFCRTRKETQEIADKLIQDGYNADSLHGELSQAQRDYVMQKFRIKNIQLLVATDVAARGLDVDDLTHVINYGLPDEVESYTHRRGRTGRAGKTGIAISICHVREKGKIREIERIINKKFDRGEMPTGEQICEKQLFNLVDQIEKVKVNEEEIASLMPSIYRKLEWLDKEDIIKRVVSLEFNRMIDYYKDNDDIEVVDENAPRESGKRGGRGEAEEGYTRFFINFGKTDELTPPQFIGELNELIRPIHQKLSGGKEELVIQYEPNTEADQLEAAVKKSREADRKQKTTLVGPHRDDLSFYVNGIDIRRFGSQGQQRTAALSLKLAEIELVKKIKKEYPILLLDDVLSELDGKRQDHLLASIRHIQTIITCTGLDDFISHSFQIDKTFRVVSGTVTCERPNKTTSQT